MARKVLSLLLLILLLQPAGSVFAQEPSGDPVYIVQSGDTLSAIAARFGISVTDLQNANDISDPNAISAGDALNIPGLEGIHGTLVVQTVPLGQNLNSILVGYGVPASVIVRLNHITSPSEVFAGTSLIIPQQENAPAFAPVAEIQPGQTLLELAVASGQNPWSLREANGLSGSWDTLPGSVLFAPADPENEGDSLISPYIQQLVIDPLPLMQGRTTLIKIATTEPVELSGELAGQPVHFFPNGENEYAALVGIPALQETGLSQVSLEGKTAGGAGFNVQQMILLAPGNFIDEVVSGVQETTIEAETIEKEDAILLQIVKQSPERAWSGDFQYPIDEPCTASGFGNRRSYNGGTYHYYHTGLDFTVCAQNLNIYAAAPGTVVFTGPLDIKGNFTVIDHGWGVYTGYAHQSAVQVSVGDRVEAGQLIGVIGNTGRSVGPHLHWEVWINGIPVDPYDWIQKTYP